MPKPSIEAQWAHSGRKNADNTAISREALSKVDWYSRPTPLKGELSHYYSDGDEEGNGKGKPTPESDSEHDAGADSKEAAHAEGHRVRGHRDVKGRSKGRLELLDGLGESSADQRQRLFAFKNAKSAYRRPPKAISSPGRDAKKAESRMLPPLAAAERMPHTFPGSLPTSGSLRPHPGILLPHYMSHNSGTHAHNKGLTSGKAVTLIPSHIKRASVKGSQPFNSTLEPFSPKVTCFGRIKIKHKCHQETQKLADMQPVMIAKDQIQHTFKKGLSKDVVSLAEESIEVAIAGRIAGGSSAPAMAEMRRSSQRRVSHTVANTVLDPTADLATNFTKGIPRMLKEAKSHMKPPRGKKPHPSTNASTLDHPSSYDEISIDLGRFPSVHTIQGQESRLPEASATLSVDEYGSFDTGFVPQVPPPNSLLLMRSSKNRVISTNLTSSSSTRNADEANGSGNIDVTESDVHRHALHSVYKVHNSKLSSASMLRSNMGEVEVAAAANGHDAQGAIMAELDVKRLCAVVDEECKFLHGKQSAIAHHQALPSTANREVRLWQRRCVMKPLDLYVGRPIAVQVNRRQGSP